MPVVLPDLLLLFLPLLVFLVVLAVLPWLLLKSEGKNDGGDKVRDITSKKIYRFFNQVRKRTAVTFGCLQELGFRDPLCFFKMCKTRTFLGGTAAFGSVDESVVAVGLRLLDDLSSASSVSSSGLDMVDCWGREIGSAVEEGSVPGGSSTLPLES